jgi:hypothetical protein
VLGRQDFSMFLKFEGLADFTATHRVKDMSRFWVSCIPLDDDFVGE